MKKAAWALATWFGCGLVPIAPGTAGTIGALPLYFAIAKAGGGTWAILVAAAIVTAVGVWAAGVVAKESGLHDPQIVVIDEVAGVLLPLAFTPESWKGVLAAVVLFRVFDQTKPFPARRAEKLPGGWGVVFDDVFAGGWAVGCVFALCVAGVLS